MLTSTYILLAAASNMTDVPYGTDGVVFGWGRQAMANEGPVTQLRGNNIITTPCTVETDTDYYDSPEFPMGTTWQKGMWPSSILPEDKPHRMFICAFRPEGVGGTCPGDDGGALPKPIQIL